MIGPMDESGIPVWLRWAREIQALSQTGLHYSQDQFNRDRYQRLMEIAAEMTTLHSSLEKRVVQESFLLQPGYATPRVDVRGAVIQERSDQAWCHCSRCSGPAGDIYDLRDVTFPTVKEHRQGESSNTIHSERVGAPAFFHFAACGICPGSGRLPDAAGTSG